MHNAHALIVAPCDDRSATYIVQHVLLLFGIYRLKLHLGKRRPKIKTMMTVIKTFNDILRQTMNSVTPQQLDTFIFTILNLLTQNNIRHQSHIKKIL